MSSSILKVWNFEEERGKVRKLWGMEAELASEVSESQYAVICVDLSGTFG